MATSKQIEEWKKHIQNYKEIYAGLYPGERASDKLVGSFCNIHGIPWPLPYPEDTEEEFDFLR